jgi:hypothetical protein
LRGGKGATRNDSRDNTTFPRSSAAMPATVGAKPSRRAARTGRSALIGIPLGRGAFPWRERACSAAGQTRGEPLLPSAIRTIAGCDACPTSVFRRRASFFSRHAIQVFGRMGNGLANFAITGTIRHARATPARHRPNPDIRIFGHRWILVNVEHVHVEEQGHKDCLYSQA